jgi:RNA recognition motif-containing protein
MIDYTNLYIKNLDPEVTSYDLFKRFKAYGKIISARVMKDTVTGISKGYGFVSFTHMDEANEALRNMDGALLNSKNIIVTFHTHKKSISQQQQQKQPKRQQEYINLSPPTSASTTTNTYNSMYPSQPSPPYHHHNTTTTPPSYGFVPEHHNIPTKVNYYLETCF